MSMRFLTGRSCFAVKLAAWVALSLSATSMFGDKNEFFERKIGPIFVEHCYQCHSHDAEKIKGGLVLDRSA